MPEPDLRFPIGKFQKDDAPSAENNRRHMAEIEAAPAQLRKAIAGLTRKVTGLPEHRKSTLTSLVSFAERFRKSAEGATSSQGR